MTIEESHIVKKIKCDFSTAIENSIFKILYNSFYRKLPDNKLNIICNLLKSNLFLILNRFEDIEIIKFVNQTYTTETNSSDLFIRSYFFQFELCLFQLINWTENFALKNEFLSNNFDFGDDSFLKSTVDTSIRVIYMDDSHFRFDDSNLYLDFHNLLYNESIKKNNSKTRHKRIANIILENEIQRISKINMIKSKYHFSFFKEEKEERLQASLSLKKYVFKLKTKEINSLSDSFTNLIYNLTSEKKKYLEFNSNIRYLLANNFVSPFDYECLNKGLMGLKTPHKKTFLYFIFLLSESKKCDLDLFINKLEEHKTILGNIKNGRISKIKKDFVLFRSGNYPKNNKIVKTIVNTILPKP